MTKKTSSEMLVEAGILPKNALVQLERHRMVPQGTAEKVGTHPVSLDQDSTGARSFANKLQTRLDNEEAEIRQQDLAVAGVQTPVWLQWGDSTMDPASKTVLVDRMGRYHLPLSALGNGQKKKIKAISLTKEVADAIQVSQTEPRYTGDQMTHLVCTLKRKK